ncbi:hypothetical protein MKY15_04030 [Sporosarcina sp. FSL K6-1540]|uniref:hypothetical protein n=1 Tax=Sporosarcina sp. FSL K6-1540 TaxID=2921555 RepID=UPI00315A7EF7
MKQLRNLVVRKNVEYFDKFVFWSCIIDILFLPYFNLVAIPYSMPLIIYWFFTRNKYFKNDKEFKLFIILFGIMCMSTLVGFLLAPQYAYNSMTYLIIFTSLILYYFMFVNFVNKYSFNLKKLLIGFIVVVVIFAGFYYIDKNLYQFFKTIWNFKSSIFVENAYEGLVGYRFSFIWQDPNNIGYMMNAIVLYLWCNEKINSFTKVFTFFALIFVLVASMSNGGFLALGISIVIYFLVSILQVFGKKKFNIKIRINLMNMFLFIGSFLLIIYIIPKIPEFLQTSTALESFERIENNSGESRFIIWSNIINNLDFIDYIVLFFVGSGGIALIDGIKINPHNGHFYWILSYGFISYLIFMYLVFRKRKITPLKKYIWIIPVFIGFTVNVMIGESKLTAIILLLVACSSSELYLKNSEKNR